jgi:hypothetical protein
MSAGALALDTAVWRKSTMSRGGACVEVAFINDQVAVRDSKNPKGAVLMFPVAEWEAFISSARNGEFDP